MGCVDSGQAKPRCQHAVERGRRSAPLNVSENGGAGFIPGPFLDLLLERVADAAEPGVAELVNRRSAGYMHRAFLGRRALGRDNDREWSPPVVSPSDQSTHLVDVE